MFFSDFAAVRMFTSPEICELKVDLMIKVFCLHFLNVYISLKL